jgi:phosphoribosyl 1,2-cyclic phosphate phosphodiesterase
MPLELLFLGTGTSAGVPMIGCKCEVCTSPDPRDQRSRPSVLVSYPSPVNGSAERSPRQFLIDTAPEMRLQVIRHDIQHIDGVLYTHAHADHVFGLDDLRRFNAVTEAPIDIYAEALVLDTLRSMFKYIFEAHHNVNPTFVATLIAHTVEVATPLQLHGATWTPLRLLHGRLPVLGFRIDYEGSSLAYCTDVSAIPPETFPLLTGLDVFVIDGLRYKHHPTHLTVEQALAVIDQVRPKRAYLTHIAHDIMHADLDPRLPEGVSIAYDGLKVRCQAGVVTTPTA